MISVATNVSKPTFEELKQVYKKLTTVHYVNKDA